MAVNIWAYLHAKKREDTKLGAMPKWGVNVMKDHIRKQTTRLNRRVRRTEGEKSGPRLFLSHSIGAHVKLYSSKTRAHMHI